MQYCKLGDTPISKGYKFNFNQCPKNDFETKEMQKIPYTSAMWSLIYAQACMCLDIAYNVWMLDGYLSNLGINH